VKLNYDMSHAVRDSVTADLQEVGIVVLRTVPNRSKSVLWWSQIIQSMNLHPVGKCWLVACFVGDYLLLRDFGYYGIIFTNICVVMQFPW
jgi:hypothetical protein